LTLQNKLYVADINRVVQINTNTAKIENVFVVDSAKGKEKIITADIEYISKKKLLIIPTLDKTVIGYKLTK
jgi:hypothetical protein